MMKKLLLLNMNKVNCLINSTDRNLQSEIYNQKFRDRNLKNRNLQTEIYSQKFANRYLQTEICIEKCLKSDA